MRVIVTHFLFFYFLPFTEALSTSDIPKLQTKVVDAIPPEVLEDMSVSQLQVSTVICITSRSVRI